MNDIMESLHAATARSGTLSRRDLNALRHDSLIESYSLSHQAGVAGCRREWIGEGGAEL